MSQLKGRKWHVQAAVAIRGEGLYEGLDWCDILACFEILPCREQLPRHTSVCLAECNMPMWRAELLPALPACKVSRLPYLYVCMDVKSVMLPCRLASTLKSMQRSGQITNVSAAGR